MPDVHIQNVRMLQADKIPSWLDLVPTCITLGNKKIYKGGDALQYLRGRLQSMQQQMARQYQQAHDGYGACTELPQGSKGPGGPNFPPTGQQRQKMSHMGPQQGQMGPMGIPPQSTRAPPQQLSSSQPSANPSPSVQSSLQPATGTGQFGCSLDMAFQSAETEEPPPNDPRFHQSGSVSQQDMQRYMQMREKMPQRRGPGNQMMTPPMQ